MTLRPGRCPHGDRDHVVKRGKTSNTQQRYLGQKEVCPQQTFGLEYRYRGRLPQGTQLRTQIKRLARKTICFSQSRQMHDLVSGLFVNRYECGVTVYITNNQI